MTKGRIRSSLYRTFTALVGDPLSILGASGKKRQTNTPLMNASAAINQSGNNNETNAKMVSAGPMIEPRLFAAPAAPMPFVLLAGVVMSAIYAVEAGMVADITAA